MGAITNAADHVVVELSLGEILGAPVEIEHDGKLIPTPVTIGRAIERVAWHLLMLHGRKFCDKPFTSMAIMEVNGKIHIVFNRETRWIPEAPVSTSKERIQK
jgi:hypothetical protein